MTDSTKDTWRLLVLEDSGDFLTIDARNRTGNQGLSRFLNAMDGLIGQGLNFSCLVTTNEEFKKLHPAVTRPGRCLSQVEFSPFTEYEAEEWFDKYGEENHDYDIEGEMTLAELYASLEGTEPLKKEKKMLMGFTA